MGAEIIHVVPLFQSHTGRGEMPNYQDLFRWRKLVASECGPEPVTRHVLLTLSLHMNQAGRQCFPSTKSLSIETGLSERSVCTHLDKAEQLGWIRKELRGVTGQAWRRSQYYALIPKALKEIPHVGTEPDSAPCPEGTEGRSAPNTEGTERGAEGTERDDVKALKDVQSSSTYNSSKNSSKKDICRFSFKMKVPVPSNFYLTASMKAYAMEKGITIDLAEFTESFIEKCRAAGRQYQDWEAAWKTWLRNELKWSAEKPGNIPPPIRRQQPGLEELMS